MLNRTREYVDDVPVSRCAKPMGYYCSTPAIDALAVEFGQFLEKILPDHKCLIGAVLFAQLGYGDDDYSIFETLREFDPERTLPNELSNAIIRICHEDPNAAIADLIRAFSTFVCDDVMNDRG